MEHGVDTPPQEGESKHEVKGQKTRRTGSEFDTVPPDVGQSNDLQINCGPHAGARTNPRPVGRMRGLGGAGELPLA